MSRRTAFVVTIALVGGAATLPAADATNPRATIYRTADDVPHVVANNFTDLGHGYGYAFAQDNVCELADDIVTIRAERARFFGPDAINPDYANLATPTNLQSDFFFQRILDDDPVAPYLRAEPPTGPLPEVRALVAGYADGYNHFLSDVGVDNITDPRCRGAAWVMPITADDLYMRIYQAMLLASSGALMTQIAAAAPPAPGNVASPANNRLAQAAAVKQWSERIPGHGEGLGSNVIALGNEATRGKGGLLLANPHFPWLGPLRMHEVQLTIPGRFNVSGVAIYGTPFVVIGHTDHMAWSHTVSTAWRFTPYELKLVPGTPTDYIFDGRIEHMTTHDVRVMARVGDRLEPRTHTFYETRFGPMLSAFPAASTPAGPVTVFDWTPLTAYAMRDADRNFRILNQVVAQDMSESVADIRSATDTYQGAPFVNTIAADDTGAAYYADHSIVPHVTDDQIQRCVDGPVGLAVMQVVGLPVLDGSTSACEWGSDPDAVVPGVFGPSHLPGLVRRDYVDNANNSYWLANPHEPLTGFPKIIGDTGTPRSWRTRLNLHMIEDRLRGTDGLPGDGFTLENLQLMAFGDRQYAGELFQDDAVAMCESMPTPAWSVSDICNALAKWDTHDNLDSAGAILFRRFVEHLKELTDQELYTVPFDASDPMNTPRGLNTVSPRVRQALRTAVDDLRTSHVAFDASLRNYQYRVVGDGQHIPIHGGPGADGVFNSVYAGDGVHADGWVPGDGYPDIGFGSSFVMAVHLDGSQCPPGRTILTYSQSTNRNSRYFADQTEQFSTKTWNPMPYCMRDILADPTLSIVKL